MRVTIVYRFYSAFFLPAIRLREGNTVEPDTKKSLENLSSWLEMLRQKSATADTTALSVLCYLRVYFAGK